MCFQVGPVSVFPCPEQDYFLRNLKPPSLCRSADLGGVFIGFPVRKPSAVCSIILTLFSQVQARESASPGRQGGHGAQGPESAG